MSTSTIKTKSVSPDEKTVKSNIDGTETGGPASAASPQENETPADSSTTPTDSGCG